MTAIYRFCSDAFVHSGAAGARAGSWLIASRAVAMGRQLRCHGANRRRLEALDGGGSCKGKRLEAPRFSQALKARNLWKTAAPHQLSHKKGNSTDAHENVGA